MQCWREGIERRPNEIDLLLVTKLAVYPDGVLKNPALEDQSCRLTTHRIVLQERLSLLLEDILGWEAKSGGLLAGSPKIILQVKNREADKRQTHKWKCPACEEDNEAEDNGGALRCAICGTRLPPRPPSSIPAPQSQTFHIIRLSFRGSGHGSFCEHLTRALEHAAWRAPLPTSPSSSGVGVGGLLKREQEKAASASAAHAEAFADIDALMGQAAEMARMAESLASRLGSSGVESEAEEQRQFQRLMQDLGMHAGSTAGNVRDKNMWHVELAKQLGALCERLFSLRGLQVLALSDAYCYLNRARGTALVSPADLLGAARALPDAGSSARLSCLPSGLLILQGSAFSPESLLERLALNPVDSISASELAKREAISAQVASALLGGLEASGLLCRDQAPSGPRFHMNLFLLT